ncbi:hypothetical protein P0D88_46570 [Paraburkholderia sp. RL18-103-BIB-C]|uniref:hypothetical protein n=1 Tax=Paraburkholderia sp. RL18-103-BIB-C TaxID=3031637 RepID=UPI0038B7121A
MANLIADEARFALARVARAVALSKGNLISARGVLEAQYGVHSLPYQLVQRAIDGTGPITDDSTAALASTALLGVSPRANLIAQIDAASGGLLHLPFVSRFLLQESGATGAWVAEGNPLPMSSGGLSLHALDVLKVGAIYVQTLEQMRTFTPAGDVAIARGLSVAVNETIATAFADPVNFGVPGEKPASVTADATVIASTGSTPANLTADMAAMVEAFDGDLASAVWLMNPGLAFAFGMIGAGIGAADLMAGGVSRLAGLPAVANQGVPAHTLILLDPSGVAVAGPVVEIDSSIEATVETQDEAGASLWLNLWQQDLIGSRSIAYVNWTARAGAAVVLADVFPAAA